MKQRLVWVVVVSVGMTGLVRGEENWPSFRGPAGTGVAENERLPDTWSATENVAWKIDLPGRGWSSPIVWENQVIVTTAVNPGDTPEAKKGLYFGGEQAQPPQAVHHWKVISLHRDNGSVLWEQTLHEGKPAWPLHIKNTYASETPVTDGERIYVCFGNLGIYCLDLSGKLLWNHPLPARKMRLGWGTAASPVLHGDRLFIVHDNEEQSYLLALDKHSGKELWRVERDEKSNWSTPFVWQNDLRTELVTPGTNRVRSYDLEGKPLWDVAGMSSITIATPYAAHGLLYVSSGYVLDQKQPLLAIRPGGQGDLSLPADKNQGEFIAWAQKKGAPYNPTTLVYGDRLYVLYDMGLFANYDARTGKEIYGGGNKRMRIPNGKAFTASPWGNDGKIFCLNEDGTTFVIQAGDEFKILHTNELAEDDMAMATPALTGDRLLIRTAARLYCLKRGE
ncbi:MAG: PQQ-binding-like beta-propeller repeat protein [Planctomycetales bacterium]